MDESVASALKRYAEQVSILKKGYEQEKYRIEHLKKSFLGDKAVREVTSVDIASYRDLRLSTVNPKTNRPLATSSVRLEMSLLSNFFEICRIEWGLCDENPVLKVRKPKPPPGRDRRLMPREERKLMRYAAAHPNKDLYSIISLALESAMRQGEILGLEWQHINLKTRVAHLPMTKNGTKRDVPLSTKACQALIRMVPKASGRVFAYTNDGLKSTWRYLCRKLEIVDLHFHDLRHEATSRLFELGTLDVMEVAAITGHKSLAMLKRYTHLRASRLARKLEGGRSRARFLFLDKVLPYPGLVEECESGYSVRLLDFKDLVTFGAQREDAIRHAQDALLRRIVSELRAEANALPTPDQYEYSVDERNVVMVDPLAGTETFNTKF